MENNQIENYIVIDLEWNYPETRYRSIENGVKLDGEILQIGAVKTDADLNTIDTYNQLIKPNVYPKVNKFVSELTEITTDAAYGGVPFEQAIREFLDWCGENSAFLTWGDGDIFMLEDNIAYFDLDVDLMQECYDVQPMFDDQVSQADRSMPLNYAMWHYDIKPARAHDALNDAVNTLEVIKRLDTSEGFEDYIL